MLNRPCPKRGLLQRLATLHDAVLELSRAESFDKLCRRAIQLGRTGLGFERLGLWFLLPEGQTQGSYGTDERGRLRDERKIRLRREARTEITKVLSRRIRLAVMEDTALFNGEGLVVGRGTRLVAALWDGDKLIGYLGADNLLHGRPLLQEDQQVLMLYANALGQLCSRTKAQEALREAHRRLASAREEERRRLSRELHDSLAQKLTGMSLRLAAIDKDLGASLGRRRVQPLVKLSGEFKGIFEDVRRMSRQLYPPALESLGLFAALCRVKDDLQTADQRITIRCSKRILHTRFEPKMEISLYRIAQEAASNAVRHGKARHVKLMLGSAKGCLRLSVTDDGCGFDIQKPPTRGLGLISMRERAEALEASFRLESRPGRTCINVQAPLANQARPARRRLGGSA